MSNAIALIALPGFITGAVIPGDGGITMRRDAGEDIGRRLASMEEVEAIFRHQQ